MKSFHYIIISLLSAFVFGGCSQDEGTGGGVIFIEEGYSQINLVFSNTGNSPRTYAPQLVTAYPQEKEIRSLAIFTQNNDDGTPGQPGFKTGAFNKYFSSEDLRSPGGLYEPLEQVGNDYITTIRVKSDSFKGNTKVMIITNYVENGLADVLGSLTQWEQLDAVRTPEVNDNLQTPLLMFGYKEVPLVSGQAIDAAFSLYRVVSRIDVINEAYNEQEPEKGFELESAQLLYPRKYSFLKPGNTRRADIPTVDLLPPILSANQPEGDTTKVVGIYAYETDNAGGSIEPTRVRIKGKLWGMTFDRVIPLKQPDEVGKVGDPIPLERNNLYVIRIQAIEGADIDWNVTVVDWADGAVVPIPPTYAVPVLTDFTFEGDGATRWDAAKKVYVYDGKQVEKIRFKASGMHHTRYDFKCELDSAGRTLGLNFSNSDNHRNLIQQTQAILVNNVVSQEYEVTLPAIAVDPVLAVPTHIKLFIRNSGNAHYADSITIRCVPDYLGINGMSPVLVGGKYWAPLNVGATTINLKTPPLLETYGYYFQWGRNLGFAPTGTVNYSAGYVSYYNATEGTHKDLFISGNSDWLLSSDPNVNKRNNLWSKDVNQSPCPKGWRVPTYPEISILNTKTCTKVDNYGVVGGDVNGKDLYLPMCGYISSGGSFSTQGSRFYYWSVPTPPASTGYNVFHYASGFGLSIQAVAQGMSLRCIQNAD